MLSTIFNFIITGFSIEYLYSRARNAYIKKGIHKYLSLYLTKKIQRKFACYLSPMAKVGNNVLFKHPVGIIIGEGVELGNNVTIYQNVTLGAARVGELTESRYPIIGDNVIIFAGAKLIGNIHIGKNVTIGANAVVLEDVPDNCIAVGIPAKIKKNNSI
ncbi:serine O-acetyltransferase [Thalassotalea agariperforans]